MNIAKQKKIIKELRNILYANGEYSWARQYQRLLQEVESQPNPRAAKNQIKKFKNHSLGGMGGATDLIFYKNNAILHEETSKYYKLLSKLGASWVKVG